MSNLKFKILAVGIAFLLVGIVIYFRENKVSTPIAKVKLHPYKLVVEQEIHLRSVVDSVYTINTSIVARDTADRFLTVEYFDSKYGVTNDGLEEIRVESWNRAYDKKEELEAIINKK